MIALQKLGLGENNDTFFTHNAKTLWHAVPFSENAYFWLLHFK